MNQELQHKVDSFDNYRTGRSWYQTIDFGNGVVSLGYGDSGDPIWKIIQPYLPDLEGKRVLDLGSNAGLHCVRSALAGAKEVVGVDGGNKDEQRVFHAQAEFVKDYFERVSGKELPISYVWKRVEDYLLNTDVGWFDVVYAFSILYHIDVDKRIRFIEKLSQITNTVLVKYRSVTDEVGGREWFSRIFEDFGFSLIRFKLAPRERHRVMVKYTK